MDHRKYHTSLIDDDTPDKMKRIGTTREPASDKDYPHLDTEFFELDAEIPKTVAICGCGRSKSLPYCDGSHGCYKPI